MPLVKTAIVPTKSTAPAYARTSHPFSHDGMQGQIAYPQRLLTNRRTGGGRAVKASGRGRDGQDGSGLVDGFPAPPGCPPLDVLVGAGDPVVFRVPLGLALALALGLGDGDGLDGGADDAGAVVRGAVFTAVALLVTAVGVGKLMTPAELVTVTFTGGGVVLDVLERPAMIRPTPAPSAATSSPKPISRPLFRRFGWSATLPLVPGDLGRMGAVG
jgi:hypothetical protein